MSHGNDTFPVGIGALICPVCHHLVPSSAGVCAAGPPLQADAHQKRLSQSQKLQLGGNNSQEDQEEDEEDEEERVMFCYPKGCGTGVHRSARAAIGFNFFQFHSIYAVAGSAPFHQRTGQIMFNVTSRSSGAPYALEVRGEDCEVFLPNSRLVLYPSIPSNTYKYD